MQQHLNIYMKKILYLEAIALFMQGSALYYLDNGVYLQIKVADNVKRSLLNFKKNFTRDKR